MSLPLAKADAIAGKISDALRPFCDRLEIAGSIRRRRPTVNDIDLVLLPKPGQLEALRARCEKNALRIQANGLQNLILFLPYPPAGREGLQLDVWIARPRDADLISTTPSNWGSLLLCRTGSKEHNIFLLDRARDLGLRWNTYEGVYDRTGFCLACETEESIFAALKLDFIRPEKRERK
jgi:DNA polymerase (family X)